MLSGRGLCDELITRPEKSYRLWRVVVCDLETSKEESKSPLKGCEYKPTMGCDAERKKIMGRVWLWSNLKAVSSNWPGKKRAGFPAKVRSCTLP